MNTEEIKEDFRVKLEHALEYDSHTPFILDQDFYELRTQLRSKILSTVSINNLIELLKEYDFEFFIGLNTKTLYVHLKGLQNEE